MLKEAPDHHNADLVLKIYDLRREPVMREDVGVLGDGAPGSSGRWKGLADQER